MHKEQKQELVSKLASAFSGMDALVVCDYKGLQVKHLEKLRNAARVQGISVQVIKNTLASLALKGANLPALELKESNVFIWGADQIALSKLVMGFAKEHKEHFIVKMGLYEKQAVDSKHIEAVSKLPSREELIGMLLSVWSAPARYFVTGLDNLRKAKEQE
ncbi:50S ribosomal protein L10 [Helicobacter heilmannii]|uniref:50S ribosomal protein L10 n=1 Tax=Helicobacter heilmannii TaxID=35817 RepID=UPI0006A176D1|nr:50S ribosomal protein L10 [Helicobacter heilmannii]GMB94595.1 50S ribosomal protein L10 (rpl1) RplJ [Helicobacter heilmannii]CRF46841.1 LSU ribosomal protein L10p (P0) [Helicobacter heilmannii]CRF50622.1 LSU ribosomal protein L10p (P0) [Helicobacter heilmannii]